MATGPQPLHYQWRRNNHDLPGVIAPHHVIANATRFDAGDYSVIISNASQVVTLLVAHVSVRGGQLLTPLGFDAGGQFVLLSGAEDGTAMTAAGLSKYVLESSPDCWNWSPAAATSSLTNGMMRFVDAESAVAGSRFYRIRELP